MTATAGTTPIAASSRLAARITIAASAAAVLLLAALHVLRPDLSPIGRMVSEYAIGPFGWVQTLVFASMAAACVSFVVAVRSQPWNGTGRVGLVLLILAAVGLATGGAFDALHPLHGAAFLLGVPTFAAGTVLVGTQVARRLGSQRAWRALLALSHLPWLASLLTIVTMIVTIPPGGPEPLVGLPNRLVWAAWAAWLIAVAHLASRDRAG